VLEHKESVAIFAPGNASTVDGDVGAWLPSAQLKGPCPEPDNGMGCLPNWVAQGLVIARCRKQY